ncbi:hypothetical protein A5674_19725 [Mycobacterium malmoense]|nr:hypothetical protein A5674_19725 [Mycobacterium malmoense]
MDGQIEVRREIIFTGGEAIAGDVIAPFVAQHLLKLGVRCPRLLHQTNSYRTHRDLAADSPAGAGHQHHPVLE